MERTACRYGRFMPLTFALPTSMGHVVLFVCCSFRVKRSRANTDVGENDSCADHIVFVEVVAVDVIIIVDGVGCAPCVVMFRFRSFPKEA